MKKQNHLSFESDHSTLVCFLSFLTLTLILALFATLAHSADVTLAWDPNSEPDFAGYKVYYKTVSSGPPYSGTGATEGDSPIDVGNVTEFTVHDLTDGVTYFFVVTAYDTEALESGYSNEVNTTSTPDTTAPIISNVQVTSTADTIAVIEWTTDEPSDSLVQYGTSSSTWGSYPSSKNDVGMVTSHSVTISGLTADTTYYFRVGSTDASGNGPDPSEEYSFTTDPTPETDPPSIEQYPTIDYVNETIDVIYDESNMQNATLEANYTFSPSLLFGTPGGSNDIAYIGSNTYRLSMSFIPNYTIFTLTVSNITDAAGNPVTPSSIRINDNDNDDIADDWEIDNGVDDPDEDPDGDELNNLEEYTNSTDPNNADTDGDELPDGWEVTYGLDPNDNTGVNGSDGDLDDDGWTNYEEYMAGINPADDTSFTT